MRREAPSSISGISRKHQSAASGSITFAIFCCSKRYGWGWDNFVQEANSGSGLKVKNWMRPICQYVVPIAVAVIYIYGLATFAWK